MMSGGPTDQQFSKEAEAGWTQGDPGAEMPNSAPSSASQSVLYPRPYDDHSDSRKYFATRPGAFDQAMDDLKAHVVTNMGETAHSFWLLTEIDHWNNEKERVLVITDSALLICKYDFIMLKCLQLQRVPLSYIDRVSLGPFTFPERSLDKREGEGLRIFWDKVREPKFLSRWNPWSTDVPFATFIEHPVKNSSQRFSAICQLSAFTSQLVPAVQNAQRKDPVPGRTTGIEVVDEPIFIDTLTGLMSFFGNRNKLGYSLARGSFGF
ncbi:tumor protein p63-regulated gene 1 protein [Anolis sagrei]|uniref:tumor protein p63-regulated gene 1 protein n=1 Tax=Anolis sagrei TaxID=38937 RepID=UPI003521752C